MNHGNWLCCHISNPSGQGVTAESVTVGRSSLLKGHTARCPREGPVGRTAPAGSGGSLPWQMEVDHSLWQEGMKMSFLKYQSGHHAPGFFSPTLPTPHHHFPRVIRLYQCTMLMTSSLIADHSSLPSTRILEEVLNNIRTCQRKSWGFEYLCFITCAIISNQDQFEFEERK